MRIRDNFLFGLFFCLIIFSTVQLCDHILLCIMLAFRQYT